jgi:hypothetical protein
VLNDNNFHSSGWGSYRQLHNVLRTFAYEQPEDAWNGSNYNGITLASENFGIVFPGMANKAFKSAGNGKVYLPEAHHTEPEKCPDSHIPERAILPL